MATDAAHDATKASVVCAAGRQLACACAGGGKGFQVCAADGSGFGACMCGGVDGGREGGRRDASHPRDAARDAARDGRADAPKDAHREAARDGGHGIDAGHGADASDAHSHDAGSTDAGIDAPPNGGFDAADASVCPLPVAADAGPGGATAWAENFGTTGYTWPTSVAIDPGSGDIVVAGFFDGTVTFGATALTSHGDAASGNDTFVARFDGSGHAKWAKDFGNGLLTSANSVAVDSSGNVAFGGGFEGTLSFGGAGAPLTAVGNIDVFVVELDPDGGYLWGKSFGAAGQYQELDSVAVDGAGSVVIGGVAAGGVDFGSGPATGYYIAKFRHSGAYAWSTAFSAVCTESSPTLAVDGQGNVVLAGCFTGTTSFGGHPLTSRSGGDAFVAKYDPSGMYLWSNDFPAMVETGGSGSDVSSGGLAIDGCGNIFILGSFGAETGSATIDFGTGTLASGVDSLFLAQLDPQGNAVWADEFVSPTEQSLFPSALVADGSGGVTLASGLAGSVDYGGGELTSPSSTTPTLSVAHFDSSGIYQWGFAELATSTATASSTALPQGLAARGARVVVAGTFGGCTANCDDGTSPPGTTLILPGATLTATSAGDMFLAAFGP